MGYQDILVSSVIQVSKGKKDSRVQEDHKEPKALEDHQDHPHSTTTTYLV